VFDEEVPVNSEERVIDLVHVSFLVLLTRANKPVCQCRRQGCRSDDELEVPPSCIPHPGSSLLLAFVQVCGV
jgi:hypothetical protein